jgi:hypothetical protein
MGRGRGDALTHHVCFGIFVVVRWVALQPHLRNKLKEGRSTPSPLPQQGDKPAKLHAGCNTHVLFIKTKQKNTHVAECVRGGDRSAVPCMGMGHRWMHKETNKGTNSQVGPVQVQMYSHHQFLLCHAAPVSAGPSELAVSVLPQVLYPEPTG